jgi:hypothetical protein
MRMAIRFGTKREVCPIKRGHLICATVGREEKGEEGGGMGVTHSVGEGLSERAKGNMEETVFQHVMKANNKEGDTQYQGPLTLLERQIIATKTQIALH